MDQVHKQAEFKLDFACNRQPVKLLQCRCHVVTKTECWPPDELLLSGLVVVGLWWHVAALNNLDKTDIEYLLFSADDLFRFWRSKATTGRQGSEGGEGVHVAGASKSIF